MKNLHLTLTFFFFLTIQTVCGVDVSSLEKNNNLLRGQQHVQKNNRASSSSSTRNVSTAEATTKTAKTGIHGFNDPYYVKQNSSHITSTAIGILYNLPSLWKYLLKCSSSINSRTFTTSVENGIGFSRKINVFQTDVLGSINLNFDANHCKSTDEHGDNNCHYGWDETMTIDLKKVYLNKAIGPNDRIFGKFKVDYFVPWEFECAICDQDCILTVPVLEWDVHIPLPPCPLGNEDIPDSIEIPLGGSSPLDGVPLHIDGDVEFRTDGDEVVASANAKVTLI